MKHFVLIVGLFAVAFVVGIPFFNNQSRKLGESRCEARWGDSGHPWRFRNGVCQVQTRNGHWLPEKAIKESL